MADLPNFQAFLLVLYLLFRLRPSMRTRMVRADSCGPIVFPDCAECGLLYDNIAVVFS